MYRRVACTGGWHVQEGDMSGFHSEKWARGGKAILTKNTGAKGVRATARLLGGYGGILNIYPKRCIFRLICGSQMT